jgi:hypothetical protein
MTDAGAGGEPVGSPVGAQWDPARAQHVTGTLRRMPPPPSRRTVVAAALAVPAASVAGCSLSGPTPRRARADSPVGRSAEVDPDVALLESVAGSTDAMVALYEGVL